MSFLRSTLAPIAFVVAACNPGGSFEADAPDIDGGGGAPVRVGSGKHAASTGGDPEYPGVNAGPGAGPQSGAQVSGSSGSGGVDVSVNPPTFTSTSETCKLINGLNVSDPTANATHTRANVTGTDLGIPVAHGGDLFLFFGDTVGHKGIWPFSESAPDAVGYAEGGRAAVAADPSRLCDGLRFLRRTAAGSVGPTLDPTIEADFAGAAMIPPSGHALSEFVRNPAGPPGQNMFPDAPGSFEVPSGAFSHDGAVYVFYTSVEGPDALTMKGAYLAKWSSPSTSGTPTYQILHTVDQRFDAAGPLGGRFVNVAAETDGGYVYLFGTGAYRESAVHLARKALATIESPGGYELFDAATGQWVGAPATFATPIIVEPDFGETSVRHFPSLGLWMFLAHAKNRVVARFASRPEGPWSEATTLLDSTDPDFKVQYCCIPENTCFGERLFNCSKASFYGAYLLPDVAVDGTSFTVSYTLSTWDPYNVALFSARFEAP